MPDKYISLETQVDKAAPVIKTIDLGETDIFGRGIHALATQDPEKALPVSTIGLTSYLIFWHGTQPTAGNFTIAIRDSVNGALGTTGNINWNASEVTMSTNIATALNAVVAGHVVQQLGISGRLGFLVTVPSGTRQRLPVLNVGSLTNGSTGLVGFAFSSTGVFAKNIVALGGASNGDIYIYTTPISASALTLVLQQSITAATITNLSNIVAQDGLVVARLGSVDGPNIQAMELEAL